MADSLCFGLQKWLWLSFDEVGRLNWREVHARINAMAKRLPQSSLVPAGFAVVGAWPTDGSTTLDVRSTGKSKSMFWLRHREPGCQTARNRPPL